jgi:hypothetical protein
MLSAAACRRRRRAIQAFECWQRTGLAQDGNPLRRLTPPVSDPELAVTAIGTRSGRPHHTHRAAHEALPLEGNRGDDSQRSLSPLAGFTSPAPATT